MSYGGRSGSSYGSQGRSSHSGFRSRKKQDFADQIAQEKARLQKMIANGETTDSSASYVAGEIDALTWVEGKIPLDSENSVSGWEVQTVPKNWKEDYGTVEAWRNGNDYIQIAQISSGDKLFQSIYASGYRYRINSNKFGSSDFKTLPEAERFAHELMSRT